MSDRLTQKGRNLLMQIGRESRQLIAAVVVFGFFVNLLMLAGPLYILNVYDRVLSSRSVETLVALTLLLAFVYIMMGILDYVRGRIMGRVGAEFQTALDKPVFDATLRATRLRQMPEQAATGVQDLEAAQRLITSPALLALFDLPWVPLFFLGIFVFHPILGFLALGGAALILTLAVLNQYALRRHVGAAQTAHLAAENISTQIRAEGGLVLSMGLRSAAFDRWHHARDRSLACNMTATDTSGAFTAIIKSFRLFLQSAILGLGAYLVLQNQLSAGAMIASSILMGRALAPIEAVIGQWGVIQRGWAGWTNLAVLLGHFPPEKQRLGLPRPDARLVVDQLTVVPPGSQIPVVRLVSFAVDGGSAVGIIGPSGAGKSSLARAMTGAWPHAAGRIQLGDAGLDQYDADALGQYIGYLPQRVQLFDGTVKENIARLSAKPDDQKVLAAAKAAAAHDLILGLSDGYDTVISDGGRHLADGAVQRIGLARALYGDPVMVVLDEPNASLDHAGTIALNRVIAGLKAEGKIVFIATHHPSGIEHCDMLLVLEKCVRKAFGPKTLVLAEVVRNHQDIAHHTGKAGALA